MPLPLARRTLAHRNLESSQLRHRLQTLDSLDGLQQIVCIRVTMYRLMEDSFESNGVFLQMLQRPTEIML